MRPVDVILADVCPCPSQANNSLMLVNQACPLRVGAATLPASFSQLGEKGRDEPVRRQCARPHCLTVVHRYVRRGQGTPGQVLPRYVCVPPRQVS